MRLIDELDRILNVKPVVVAEPAPKLESLKPPPTAKMLEECCGSAMPYPSYPDQKFEDKLRSACGLIRSAITEEAFSGLGDDGRRMKRPDYNAGEEDVWSQVDRMIQKAVYPDMFKPLVQQAKDILNANLE